MNVATYYTDTRKVEHDLPGDLPEHRTPKGNRPIQPRWLRVRHTRSYPQGRTTIYVELGGSKLENDARYGRSTIGASVTRTFGTPWSLDRSHDVIATFDELGLPEWARPYVEGNTPPWWPGALGATS